MPLSGVFELIKTDGEEIEIQPISGLERLHKLIFHTYRNILIPRLELTEWHFNTVARIASQINIFQLRRPNSSFTAHQLVNLILTTLNKEE